MALLKKSIAQRLFSMSRISSRMLTNCRTSSPRTAAANFGSLNRAAAVRRAPDCIEEIVVRRFLHRQAAASSPPALGFIPTGEKLVKKLRGMDIARERIRLAEVRPLVVAEQSALGKVTLADAKKILRLSQLEKLKSRLRQIEKDCISYTDFIEICAKECLSVDQGQEFAKMLDESGTVIVLGNSVFLRPEQVVKAIQGLMPVSSPSSNPNEPRTKELQELEKQKAAIDSTAEASVKWELGCGLAYLVVQTAAFMRLTFWELTWDVMEPICFFTTSMYFIGAYTFFLRTAKEPSFESFYQTRFSTKQRRLFKAKSFDVKRYNELKNACYSQSQRS